MIKRIVKMEFEPENVSAFVNIFKTNKDKITTFDGCHSVELLRDINTKISFSPTVYGILKALSINIESLTHLKTFGLKQNLYFPVKLRLGALKRFNIFASHMYALFKKEINTFFSHNSGVIIILSYLLTNGAFFMAFL